LIEADGDRECWLFEALPECWYAAIESLKNKKGKFFIF